MKSTTWIALVVAGAAVAIPPLVAAQSFDDWAPVVVKTVPEPGATNVPPGEFEVKVTFSREMRDRCWSWCTVWDDSNPEGLGRPRYDDSHRTCSLKVKLEPGKTYGYWLNSGRFTNFKDTEGRAAVPYLLVFSTPGAPASAGKSGDKAGSAGEPIETLLNHALAESSPSKREAEFDHIQQTINVEDIPMALAILTQKHETGMHSPFGELAAKWAGADPAHALLWATNVPDADVRKSAVVNMMRGWAQTSPEKAADQAAALPPGSLHDDAVCAAVNEWSFRDARGAAAWVSHLPDGPLRVKAAGPIIFWGRGQCPAAVAEMLDAIGDADLTKQNAETVAQLWLRHDEAAARAWLQKAPLSDETKQHLLNSNQ